MRFFVSCFFFKQLLPVPIETLRIFLNFNTITEELFDFKGDPQCIHYRESRLTGLFTLGDFRLPSVFITEESQI